MNLEAQLLQIIEQQQQQLKEQQQALQLIQTQSKTISELESYCNKLITHFNTLTEKEKEMKNHIRQLQNPKLSETLLQNLESSLKQRLQSHLEQLVTGLNLKNEINELLPTMIYTEIEKQTAPLTQQLQRKLDSSTTVSRKIRGFDQTNIFKALDELDRRRELQLEQQRKNDKSYSPRF